MKTKLKEHLLKHGVKKEIANDKTLLGLIDEFIEQFRHTLPYLPTDKEIEKMATEYSLGYKFALKNTGLEISDEDVLSAKCFYRNGLKDMRDRLNQSPVVGEGWVSVEERPLFTKDERGNWICTEDGDKEFIAALPYNDSKRPNEDLWWIRHCVVVDETGLCVVTDDDSEPAGWNLEDVTHWMPLPPPPTQ